MTAALMQRGVVTVVPVTSNVANVYPFQVLLPAGEVGLGRLGAQVGRLTPGLAEELDDALRLHLGL